MSSPNVLARSGDSRLRFQAGGVVMEIEAKNLGLLVASQPVLYLWRDDPYRVVRYETRMWGTNPRTQVERMMPVLVHEESRPDAFDPRETVIDVPIGGSVYIAMSAGLPSNTFDYDGGHFALVKISGNGTVDGCYPDDRTPWLLTIGRGVLFVAAAMAAAYVAAPIINGAIASAGAETAVTVAPAAPATVTPAVPAVVAAPATVTGTPGFTLAEIAAGAKTAAGIATSAATVVKTVSDVSNAGINWGNVKDAAKNAADIAASAERAKLSVDNLTGDPQTMLYIGAALLAVMVI